MPIYDGLVTMADTEIPVVVELDDLTIRLSASGTEIGEWTTEECRISHVEDTTYAISAENETLTFVPSQPTLFAAAVENGAAPTRPVRPTNDVATQGPEQIIEAPPPGPVTRGLFYALCAVTMALGVWSLVSIIL